MYVCVCMHVYIWHVCACVNLKHARMCICVWMCLVYPWISPSMHGGYFSYDGCTSRTCRGTSLWCASMHKQPKTTQKEILPSLHEIDSSHASSLIQTPLSEWNIVIFLANDSIRSKKDVVYFFVLLIPCNLAYRAVQSPAFHRKSLCHGDDFLRERCSRQKFEVRKPLLCQQYMANLFNAFRL
jgi:hypothetical protein